VRFQLTGQVAQRPITVAGSAARPVAAPIKDEVIARQTDAIEAVLSRGNEVTIPVFDSEHAAGHRKLADSVKKTLNAAGVKVKVMDPPKLGTYTLAYVWSDREQAENDRIDRGELIGEIKTDVHRNEHFYSPYGKYRYGGHLILFDLADVDGDSPMAEQLQSMGVLWPELSAAFPGEGRAVVQLVHDVFDPDRDAIVISAVDVGGLKAGIGSLADLPDDWIGASVSQARTALMQQWNIHGAVPAAEPGIGLTAKGLVQSDGARPFSMAIAGDKKPPTPDQVKPAPQEHTYDYHPIPREVAFKKEAYAEQRSDDGWVNASPGHGATMYPDLRFMEAIAVPVKVDKPGKYEIKVTGVFRYSDRQPRSQPSWEEVLELYEQVVKDPRQPMYWELQVNKVPVGKLIPTATAEAEVPVETLPFYVQQKPRSIKEEVVSELTGTVELRRGRHLLRLVFHNMVDGQLESLNVERAK
jgi:hypothetical protein